MGVEAAGAAIASWTPCPVDTITCFPSQVYRRGGLYRIQYGELGVGVIGIALTTVGFHAMKAALADPVKSVYRVMSN